MKKQPLISVIVASYNYAKYIKEPLDSLIRQTNKSFEVIVVDDGSRDQSLPIIEEYANRFKNIKLYTHPSNQNRGLAETVKLGIAKMCIRDSSNSHQLSIPIDSIHQCPYNLSRCQ